MTTNTTKQNKTKQRRSRPKNPKSTQIQHNAALLVVQLPSLSFKHKWLAWVCVACGEAGLGRFAHCVVGKSVP